MKDLRVINEIKSVVQAQYNSVLMTAFPDSNLEKLCTIDKDKSIRQWFTMIQN